MCDPIDKPERATQQRVIELFTRWLGYRYLGDWSERGGNDCIEESLLADFLARSGYGPAQRSAALHRLRSEALLHGRTLVAANQGVYQLLRYGIPAKAAAGELNETEPQRAVCGADGLVPAALEALAEAAQRVAGQARGLGLLITLQCVAATPAVPLKAACLSSTEP